ncbi:MAG: hypothetical protein H7Z14_08625 [Anaerolineae bacterium]|nr:hypothetical protein [Phycisphaerae bacterium]
MIAHRHVRRTGISLIYAMVAMVVLVGFVSLAVDLGRVQLAKTELQQATDAAARYAGGGMWQSVATVKSRVATAGLENMVDGKPLVIDPAADLEFGTWNAATKTFTVLVGSAQTGATAVRVTGRRSASRGTAVPTFFGKLLGRNTIDMKATAIAAYGQGADVVLIQDITTSFSDELADAKVGDQALVDTLYANGSGITRIAILVHTGWGKTLAPLTVVGTNYSYLTNIVSSIKLAGSPGMPVASGTDIAAGFDEALKVYTAPGYVAPAGGKVVVLVSDGQPTSSSAGSHPGLSDAQMLTLAQTRANQLWAQNVHIYIVFFDRDNDAAAANKLKTLTRGNGDFVAVSDPKDLPTALAEVTKRLPLKLVK